MRPFAIAVNDIAELLGEDTKAIGALRERHEELIKAKASTEQLARRYAEAIVTAHVLTKSFEVAGEAIEALVNEDSIGLVIQIATSRFGAESFQTKTTKRLQSLPPLHGPNRDFSHAVSWVENLLSVSDADQRKSAGVYFTPRYLADFVIDRVEGRLRGEFGFSKGLADERVRIVDFSAGAGSFLLAAVDRLIAAETGSNTLLNRISGVELLPAACVAARILLAARCEEKGVKVTGDHSPNVILGNALEERHWRDRRQSPVTVILGNPPFLSSSQIGQSWIENLMRGRVKQPGGEVSYHAADSNPERKTWLQDDYVRFIRLGQFLLEPRGVMGLVTNRGYLENLTFRGMRKSMLAGFSNIEIHDFGLEDQTKREAPMQVRQPLAVSILSRKSAFEDSNCEIIYTQAVVSDRTVVSKSNAEQEACQPAAPDYFFRPDLRKRIAEYETGVPLNEVMPTYGSAAVTARDHFVIGLNENEVTQRLEEFVDAGLSDQQIREKYFTRTRSRRFAPGDTRGFNLSNVRKELAADDSWRQKIERFTYRPFDQRSIAWDDRLIDWPRTRCMDHLQGDDNLALITRRQAPFTNEYSFFWVARKIVIDGIIRNDNRGNESFHPLWVDDDCANFDPQWFTDLCDRIGLANPIRNDELGVFQFLYAQLNSRIYRKRFAAELCIGYPRVFFPHDRSLFDLLADAGGKLIELHAASQTAEPKAPTADTILAPSREYPKWQDAQIWLSKESSLKGVNLAVWEFKVGSHQVCRKWLTARRGRELGANDWAEFWGMVHAIEQTIEITASIDKIIESRGGWRRAFA